MNKFKFNILTLGVAAMVGLSACSDSFLVVSSKTDSDTDSFYKTEADAWRALLGCYDGWRKISSCPGIGFYVASTVMSDETYGGSGVPDDRKYQMIDRFDRAESQSTMSVYEADWKAYYAAVYRCNMLISKESQIQWLNDDVHARYMGECRALRAILYFDMVRLWGNIPLFLEPVNENRSQADPAEVYAAIFEDLKYAAANIPADAGFKDGSMVEAESGRVTKYAAEALLARAYLFYAGYYGKEPGFTDAEGNTTGTFTKAEALAAVEDVINSGYYGLLSDFATLWPASSLVPIPGEVGWDAEKSTYAGDANKEILLAQKFTPTQDYNGNDDSNRWLVMMGMRKINASPYGKGWGACTVCPSYLKLFPSNDKRMVPSVIDLQKEGVVAEADYEAGYKDWREYTGYTVKKYSPLCYGNGSPGTNADGTAGFQECNPQQWVIVRYADVLLMAAELGSPKAADYMHLIRDRAGLSDIPVTKDNIMAERARELAFEGIRYWDLLRQGLDVAADAIVASAGTVYNGGIEAEVTFKREKIIETKGLSQIPQNQITLSNGVLKQNTGW